MSMNYYKVVQKNYDILSHYKYSENSMTELSRNIAVIFLLTYSL